MWRTFSDDHLRTFILRVVTVVGSCYLGTFHGIIKLEVYEQGDIEGLRLF